jgi:hypothetical protein
VALAIQLAAPNIPDAKAAWVPQKSRAVMVIRAVRAVPAKAILIMLADPPDH